MYLDRILPTRLNHMCVKWQCVEMPLQWGGLTTVRKCCNVWHLQDQKFALSRSLAITSILFFCFALYFFFSIALFAGGSSGVWEFRTPMAVLFIRWRERHRRNKSTLSFLRDMEYQKFFCQEDFFSNKLEYLNLTTEKTVEIFHSKWRNYGNKQDDGNSCARTASAIASCGFLTTCKEYWMCLLLKKIKKKKTKIKKIASGLDC